MDERVQQETDSGERPKNPTVTDAFTRMEHWISIGIGGILIVATLLLLTGTLASVWDVVRHWPVTDNISVIVDKLLFTLMLVEILHTVRQSITSNHIYVEPFLIVGVIASVRRILIVTVEVANEGKGQSTTEFMHAMIELGVLGALTLVLIVSMYLARHSRRFTRSS